VQSRKTREELLETRVNRLLELTLVTTCHEGCERAGVVRLAALDKRLYGVQLRYVLRRLTCSGCRRPPARVAITNLPDIDATATEPRWRVEVWP
jgi:RNase P subunit RPR2